MTPYIFVDGVGRICGSGQVQKAVIAHLTPPEGCTVVTGVDAPTGDSAYFDAKLGAVVPTGARPSPHHVFDYAVRQWVDPRTQATEWATVRRQRDALLAQSDWTQLPDVPLATKETWAIYRQALRDVTLQPDPFSVVWPVAPG